MNSTPKQPTSSAAWTIASPTALSSFPLDMLYRAQHFFRTPNPVDSSREQHAAFEEDRNRFVRNTPAVATLEQGGGGGARKVTANTTPRAILFPRPCSCTHFHGEEMAVSFVSYKGCQVSKQERHTHHRLQGGNEQTKIRKGFI